MYLYCNTLITAIRVYIEFVPVTSKNCALHKSTKVHEPSNHVLQNVRAKQNQRQSKFV